MRKTLGLFTLLGLSPLGALPAHAANAPAVRPLDGFSAEPSPTPGRPLLVGIMLSSAQVLLWDDEAGEYQLRRLGDEIGGAKISAVEGNRVVLERAGAAELLELSAPPQRRVVTDAARTRIRRAPGTVILGVSQSRGGSNGGADEPGPPTAAIGTGAPPSAPSYSVTIEGPGDPAVPSGGATGLPSAAPTAPSTASPPPSP